MNKKINSIFKFRGNLLLLSFLISSAANALTSSNTLVWEKTLYNLLESVRGPVAIGFGTIAIIGAGVTWAFSDSGEGLSKSVKIVLAIAIMVGAASIMTSFFRPGGTAFLLP